jgi:hypothetical protein
MWTTATGDEVAVVPAARAPVAALRQLATAAPPLPADELRERVEAEDDEATAREALKGF